MREYSELFEYQRAASDFVVKKRRCALFLGLGLGKTIITLTAFDELYRAGKAKHMLIIAPLKVAEYVWNEEKERWAHMRGYSFAHAIGSAAKRFEAVNKRMDITIIGKDNTDWLDKNYPDWYWDMIVIDESTAFKNHTTKRWKVLYRRLITDKNKRVCLITGTPSPNGIVDLFGQMKLIDDGYRLGYNRKQFDTRWMRYYGGKSWMIRSQSGIYRRIQERISDVVFTMRSISGRELPPKIIKKELLTMPERGMSVYDDIENNLVMRLQEKDEKRMERAGLWQKLLQVSNGAIYTENGNWIRIHDTKLERLEELLEDNKGENIIIAYSFQHDKERLRERFDVQFLTPDTYRRWDEGRVPLLAVNPASCGHGLNLQRGGSIIIFFGNTFNLEHRQQMIGRVHRTGQKVPVRIIDLVMRDTIEETLIKVLGYKNNTQKNLLETLESTYIQMKNIQINPPSFRKEFPKPKVEYKEQIKLI